jgi:hypothetical protein
MRSAGVLFTGSDFKPNSILFPFFDATLVEEFTARANKIILAKNNLGYKTSTSDYEVVSIINNTTSTTNGTATIVKTSNTEAFIVNVSPNTALNIANANLVGTISGTSVRINGYEHYSGNANTATVSSITLRIDASGANNEVYYANTANSTTIFITAGTGAGQTRTMNAYNSVTRTANITSNWTTVPDNTSIYSIGRPTTTFAGDIAGVYTIPTSTFRVGEKRFRLIDNNTNDVGSSSTNGDASFFAQGILQKVENTIVSATVPSLQRAVVTDERVTTTVELGALRHTGWVDPLAQTFLIASNSYPNGLFINRVRFCFKSKDDTVPVTLQIRPTVNGYPSYAVIYPYATVTLTLTATSTVVILAVVTGYSNTNNVGWTFSVAGMIDGTLDSGALPFNGSHNPARNEALFYIHAKENVPAGSRICKLQCKEFTSGGDNQTTNFKLIAIAFTE